MKREVLIVILGVALLAVSVVASYNVGMNRAINLVEHNTGLQNQLGNMQALLNIAAQDSSVVNTWIQQGLIQQR